MKQGLSKNLMAPPPPFEVDHHRFRGWEAERWETSTPPVLLSMEHAKAYQAWRREDMCNSRVHFLVSVGRLVIN